MYFDVRTLVVVLMGFSPYFNFFSFFYCSLLFIFHVFFFLRLLFGITIHRSLVFSVHSFICIVRVTCFFFFYQLLIVSSFTFNGKCQSLTFSPSDGIQLSLFKRVVRVWQQSFDLNNWFVIRYVLLFSEPNLANRKKKTKEIHIYIKRMKRILHFRGRIYKIKIGERHKIVTVLTSNVFAVAFLFLLQSLLQMVYSLFALKIIQQHQQQYGAQKQHDFSRVLLPYSTFDRF